MESTGAKKSKYQSNMQSQEKRSAASINNFS